MSERAVELCKPCAMELRRRGRALKTQTEGTRKITCRLCDRRRYGQTYVMTDGGTKKQ